MKTIFITISRGLIARNILQTDVFSILKKAGLRIVLLTPAYQDKRFLEEFKDNNVFIERLIEPKLSFFEKIFSLIHRGLIYNSTIDIHWRYGVFSPKETTYFNYIVKKIIFKPLSLFPFLREVARWFDLKLFSSKLHSDLFEKYNPSLVFATSVAFDGDSAVLKEARSRHIPTVGMAKSWDNFCKNTFRVKVDKLIVWSEFMKEQAIEYQNYSPQNIYISGIPQLDHYTNREKIQNRQDFFQKIGADPDKRLILFGSEGRYFQESPEVVEILNSFISGKLLNESCQILIRPHIAHNDDIKRFELFRGKPNIILDDSFQPAQAFKDPTDYSKEQMVHLATSLYHCDVLIASASTLILDGAAFDKPMINIGFDGFQKKPYSQSIIRQYDTAYYKGIVDTDAAWIVKSQEELLQALNSYLADPAIRSQEREELRQKFCYKIDGKSGERIAEYILKNL
ncbi:MAG: CDP-glycerol glycerophosphotransferase family protein [Candidatus Nealsonbacteria bacterium]